MRNGLARPIAGQPQGTIYEARGAELALVAVRAEHHKLWRLVLRQAGGPAALALAGDAAALNALQAVRVDSGTVVQRGLIMAQTSLNGVVETSGTRYRIQRRNRVAKPLPATSPDRPPLR